MPPALCLPEAVPIDSEIDGQIDGQIDQLGQLLLLNRNAADAKKHAAIEKWATQLSALNTTVLGKLN